MVNFQEHVDAARHDLSEMDGVQREILSIVKEIANQRDEAFRLLRETVRLSNTHPEDMTAEDGLALLRVEREIALLLKDAKF